MSRNIFLIEIHATILSNASCINAFHFGVGRTSYQSQCQTYRVVSTYG